LGFWGFGFWGFGVLGEGAKVAEKLALFHKKSRFGRLSEAALIMLF
jgi:hypothetical protein